MEGRPVEHVKKHIHAKVVQIGSEDMQLGQGKNFRRALTNFCRNNKVDMVALQETRCSGSIAQNTIKKIRF